MLISFLHVYHKDVPLSFVAVVSKYLHVLLNLVSLNAIIFMASRAVFAKNIVRSL